MYSRTGNSRIEGLCSGRASMSGCKFCEVTIFLGKYATGKCADRKSIRNPIENFTRKHAAKLKRIDYICNETARAEEMQSVSLNTLSFAGTFLVICSLSMILIKSVVSAFTRRYNHRTTDYRIIIAGVLIALSLIPFYYLPH
jgi:hypothetical protein